MKSGIYCIKNILNNKLYVGSSTRIYDRFYRHKKDLQSNTHCNRYLQNSWNKYGEGGFKFEVIEECSKENLIEREQYWLDFYKENGKVYNVRLKVESNRGLKHSAEHNRKIGDANRGKKISDEQKKKVSDSLKGRKLTKESIEKRTESRKNYKHSEDTKDKMKKNHWSRKENALIISQKISFIKTKRGE